MSLGREVQQVLGEKVFTFADIDLANCRVFPFSIFLPNYFNKVLMRIMVRMRQKKPTANC